MPAPYSNDLRYKVVKAYEDGEGSQSEIAARFSISLPSFNRYWKQYKETGNVSAKLEKSGRPRAIKDEGLERIESIVKDKPDLTINEICIIYNRNRKKRLAYQSCTVLFKE